MLVLKSELVGAAFTLVFAIFLRFLYRFSGKDNLVRFIAPKNSSGFENLKLIFVPQLIYALPQYFFIGKNYQSFFTAKVFGVTFGILADLVLFFIVKSFTLTYSKGFDILEFFLGTAAAAFFSAKFVETGLCFNFAALILLVFLILCFITFTLHPLNESLFRAPKKKKHDICIKLDK